MPLYKQWNITTHARAAIWKIEEPEAFFAERTGLAPDIKHDKRRVEHLAGRCLLQYLEKDFPIQQIGRDGQDKPRVPDNRFFFSISHSWPYVAALIDTQDEAGIDIQTWHPRMQQLQHKFLSEEEQQLFKNDIKLLTVAWCAKEAAYKWNGHRGVDFIEHLPIHFFSGEGENSEISIYLNMNNNGKMIFIENIITTYFACSWVARADEWAIY